VLVIDEPVAVENFLSSAFQTLEQRHAETDAADDLGLRPEELYLTAEELRSRIDSKQRVELRALGRTVAATDQEFALEAEEPKISVGKERGRKRPLFLFPHVDGGQRPPLNEQDAGRMPALPGEIEWKAQSVMRYHGRLPDLARDVIARHANSKATTLFVMPSRGVAERVTEILREYEVNARLTSFEDQSDAPATAQAVVTFGNFRRLRIAWYSRLSRAHS